MSALAEGPRRPTLYQQILDLKAEIRHLHLSLDHGERVIEDLHAENGLLRDVFHAAELRESPERRQFPELVLKDQLRLEAAMAAVRKHRANG